MRVSVLGVQYAVEYRTRAQDPELEAADCDGYCDTSLKLCVARKYTAAERREPGSLKDLDAYMRKCMRHELVHAFLYESGLSINGNNAPAWPTNEEMVGHAGAETIRRLDSGKMSVR